MFLSDGFTECENDVRLDGKVALVTGATSGIGLEVAKNLAKRGAKVIITGRNPSKLADAKDKVIETAGHGNVVTREMDYESLRSVRNLAQEMTAEPRLDILINNIGAIGLEDKLSQDGLNTMMQVNYFGAFLLTFLLFPLLKASAPSRIINVSSFAELLGHIDVDHMNDVGRYSNFGLYSNAKLADVLFTVEMDKRIEGSGVQVYSMDPGLGKSEFFRNVQNVPLKNFLNYVLMLLGRPLHRVALIPVFLATDPSVQSSSGKHFRDCREFSSSWFPNDYLLTRRLWEESKRLVKITKEEDWELNGT